MVAGKTQSKANEYISELQAEIVVGLKSGVPVIAQNRVGGFKWPLSGNRGGTAVILSPSVHNMNRGRFVLSEGFYYGLFI